MAESVTVGPGGASALPFRSSETAVQELDEPDRAVVPDPAVVPWSVVGEGNRAPFTSASPTREWACWPGQAIVPDRVPNPIVSRQAATAAMRTLPGSRTT